MLNIEGQNIPLPEKILGSTKIIKLSSKNQRQRRYLLLTDKALYTISDGILNKSSRRVCVEDIWGVTISEQQPQVFAIHIPSSYDVRFEAHSKDKRDSIILSLRQIYGKRKMSQKRRRSKSKMEFELKVRSAPSSSKKTQSLKELTINKIQARKLTSEEIMQRRQSWTSNSDPCMSTDTASSLNALQDGKKISNLSLVNFMSYT